jgi:hypothetical protein
MGNISSCNTTHQAHKRNEEVASFFSTINPFKYKKLSKNTTQTTKIDKTKQQMFKQNLADKTKIKTKNKSKRTRF